MVDFVIGLERVIVRLESGVQAIVSTLILNWYKVGLLEETYRRFLVECTVLPEKSKHPRKKVALYTCLRSASGLIKSCRLHCTAALFSYHGRSMKW